MKKTALLSLLFLFFVPPGYSQELRMLYMAQSGYQPSEIVERVKSYQAKTGIMVHLSFVEYEDQYNLIIRSSQKPTADYDVILLDLIWTADFAERKIIDPIPLYLESEVKRGIIPEIYTAFQYDDRIWAIPFLANFQLFYTNTELLHEAGFDTPPSSLEEVVDMAKAAKEKGLIKYPLFDSFRKQEALVCEYVWLVGAFGGDLADSRGNINLATGPALRALEFIVGLLEQGLMNPYSLDSEEVFASEVFLSGDCLFTTNWTFLSGLIKESQLPISKSGKASLIPIYRGSGRTDNSSTVSGFQGLTVTRNSLHKKRAWDFIRYLSSPEFQRMHLEEMSVWRQVWAEEKTHYRDPDIELKKKQIVGVHNRPIHPQYRKISASLQNWIYEALLSNVSPEYALNMAQREINRLIQGD